MISVLHRLLPKLPVCIGRIEVGGRRHSTGSRTYGARRMPERESITLEPNVLPFIELHQQIPPVFRLQVIAESGASSSPAHVNPIGCLVHLPVGYPHGPIPAKSEE